MIIPRKAGYRHNYRPLQRRLWIIPWNECVLVREGNVDRIQARTTLQCEAERYTTGRRGRRYAPKQQTSLAVRSQDGWERAGKMLLRRVSTERILVNQYEYEDKYRGVGRALALLGFDVILSRFDAVSFRYCRYIPRTTCAVPIDPIDNLDISNRATRLLIAETLTTRLSPAMLSPPR